MLVLGEDVLFYVWWGVMWQNLNLAVGLGKRSPWKNGDVLLV
jgi:hypothetical protein